MANNLYDPEVFSKHYDVASVAAMARALEYIQTVYHFSETDVTDIIQKLIRTPTSWGIENSIVAHVAKNYRGKPSLIHVLRTAITRA